MSIKNGNPVFGLRVSWGAFIRGRFQDEERSILFLHPSLSLESCAEKIFSAKKISVGVVTFSYFLSSRRTCANLEGMREKILRLNLFTGLALLSISAVLLALSVPFMKSWFYTFAWWSFILFADGLNFRLRRRSLLSRSVKEFFLLAFFSISFWCLFELLNLRLENWSYHDLPVPLPERWLGYFLSYATVIPALKELEIFWMGFLGKKRLALFRLKVNPGLLTGFSISGAICLLLPMAWPGLFFPLIWLAFIFLLEPLNFSRGNPSILAEVQEGRWGRFWSLVLAGLLAGIFWEFFNFWAGSHWEYSLPYLNFGRVFQMPVLGFTGFLPFTLETFAVVSLFISSARKWGQRKVVQLVFFPVCLLFDAFSFLLIDLLTFKP
jgi:hypothetical protein